MYRNIFLGDATVVKSLEKSNKRSSSIAMVQKKFCFQPQPQFRPGICIGLTLLCLYAFTYKVVEAGSYSTGVVLLRTLYSLMKDNKRTCPPVLRLS